MMRRGGGLGGIMACRGNGRGMFRTSSDGPTAVLYSMPVLEKAVEGELWII